MKWEEIKLAKLTSKIGSGITPRGGKSVYLPYGIPLIRSQNIYNSEFKTNGLAYISDEVAEKMKGVSVLPNDILLNITGDSVARCCAAPSIFREARVNQHVSIIRTLEKKLNPLYLMYFLVSPYMQATMLSYAGSGGTRKALTKQMLNDFEIPLPPLPIQQRIASILSAYDDLIENNLRRIELLEKSARELYKEWFVRFKFPGYKNGKFVDGLPEEWERKKLGEVCRDIRDSVNPKDVPPSTPYIGLEHIPRRSITLSKWETAEKINSSKFTFVAGDILFGKIRPYFHKVGFTLTDGITSSDSIVIRVFNQDNYNFLLCLLSSDSFIEYVSKTVKEGSKMPRADWGNLKLKYELMLPSKNTLKQFNNYINPVIKNLNCMAIQNQNLKKARDLLLPKLLKGEIDV